MNKIGIMQGRLSPPQGERLQFFPEYWQKEFLIGRQIGFDCISWYIDHRNKDSNPFFFKSFKDKYTKDLTSSLPIVTIDCGKYCFLGDAAQNSIADLCRLISNAPSTLETLVIPFLEQNRLKIENEAEIRKNLELLLLYVEDYSLKIALEVEYSATDALVFLSSFNSERIGVCYDIGNATSYGFDCAGEIAMLANRIFVVHIKDRKIGSEQSVYLGTGDADFRGCFESLKKNNFQGPYILQAWRGKDYLTDAKNQLEFVRSYLKSGD